MQSIDEIEKQTLTEQLSIWRWKTWGVCLFLPIFFIAISYHFLMLSHFGYRAFESLPTISGLIEKLEPCHRQRTGENSSALFQNVTIQNELKQSTTILIPCLHTFPEQLTGLPIAAWQEN